MLAIDTTGTSETRANTGIQRVTRSLVKSLSSLTEVQPVCLDSTDNCWRTPTFQARKRIYHQEDLRPGTRRGATRRSWTHILQGIRLKKRRTVTPFSFEGFIEPEIFSHRIYKNLQDCLHLVGGPSLALYYDATSLKLPELSPEKNTFRFPAYLQELLHFDGIAAISEASKKEIIKYWQWLGIKNVPVIETIPLAVDMSQNRQIPESASTKVQKRTILCVGSIEGRKNQVSLLNAAEILWRKGHNFQLKLLGLANPETCNSTLALLRKLQQDGRPLRWLGPKSEEDLRNQYVACYFTVYPSLTEGFGLPVLESLKHGKPCICSAEGAIGEISTQGGCLTVEKPTPEALATAMEKLLSDPSTHAKLCEEARGRVFRTWSDYAMDILEFHKSLR